MEWLKKMAQMLKGAAETGAEAYGSASSPMAPEHAKIMANVLADMTPGVGDIKSGVEGVQAAREGDWIGAGMGALGALPFIPAMGGIIKQAGNLPKSWQLPEEIQSARKLPIFGTLPESAAWDAGGMIRENMTAKLSALKNGDYLVQGLPAWGGKNQPFFAVGDDADELAKYAVDRLSRSDRAISAAEASKFNNSFAGKLKAATGEDFSHFNSARSDSKYAVHGETGAKIRVSDHELPGHYDAPDLSIPSWTPEKERIDYIKRYLAALKNSDEMAAFGVQQEVGRLWK